MKEEDKPETEREPRESEILLLGLSFLLAGVLFILMVLTIITFWNAVLLFIGGFFTCIGITILYEFLRKPPLKKILKTKKEVGETAKRTLV